MEKILIKSIAIVFFVVLYVKRRSIYYWKYVFNGHLFYDIMSFNSSLAKSEADGWNKAMIDSFPNTAPVKPPRKLYCYPDEDNENVYIDFDNILTHRKSEDFNPKPESKKNESKKKNQKKPDPIETRISENGTIEYYCEECTIWSPNYDWVQSDHEKTTRYRCYCGKSYYVKHD